MAEEAQIEAAVVNPLMLKTLFHDHAGTQKTDTGDGALYDLGRTNR